jgi:4-amino-4-deoxy-L-arabinose transferase-like glycosyltransferase
MLTVTRREAGWFVLLLFLSGFIAVFRADATGLIDPDEPFYALTAREMIERGDPMTPVLFGQPQFEKPIFAYWVTYAAFKIFGVSERSARLGPALAGILLLVVTYFWAGILFGRARTALYAALTLATCGMFVVLSRTVLTDMFLGFFVTAALASYSAGERIPIRRNLCWHLFFVFSGLAFLTKGPLGILLPLAAVGLYAVWSDRPEAWRRLPWATGLLVFSFVALPWYGLMAMRHGPETIWHFFLHENVRRFFVAEHRSFDRAHFYPFVVLFGFFPWSGILMTALGERLARWGRGGGAALKARIFLSSAIVFPIVFFSAAESKLLSYLFPLFPAAAILVGDWLERFGRLLRMSAGAPSAAVRVSIFLGWCILPAGFLAGLVAYDARHDFGLIGPVLAAGMLAVAPCVLSYVFFLKRQLNRAIQCTAAMTCLFSVAAFGWVLPKTEIFISSRPIVRYLQKAGEPAMFLTSKLFVRGVSYYSRVRAVGVLTGNPARAFYTRHPVPLISKPDDLMGLSNRSFPVYGYFRPKEMEILYGLVDDRFTLKVLRFNPQRLLVRVDRRPV